MVKQIFERTSHIIPTAKGRDQWVSACLSSAHFLHFSYSPRSQPVNGYTQLIVGKKFPLQLYNQDTHPRHPHPCSHTPWRVSQGVTLTVTLSLFPIQISCSWIYFSVQGIDTRVLPTPSNCLSWPGRKNTSHKAGESAQWLEALAAHADGPKFSSQHPRLAAHKHVNPAQGLQHPLLTPIGTHVHTHMKIIKKL